MRMCLTILWILIVCTAFPAVGEVPFPNYPEPNLPELGPCVKEAPKELPLRWEATTLMAPYVYTGEPYNFFRLPERASLVVGKFVFNDQAKLMRVTQLRVTDDGKHPLDLLITDGGPTYVLHSSKDKPYYSGHDDDHSDRAEDVQCIGKWITTYDLPPRTWPSADPNDETTCVGTHPIPPNIDGQSVEWWKQRSPIMAPGAEGQAADWYWLKKNGFPVRTMFWDQHDGLPAILGEYAFTNFYEFKRGNQINLRKIFWQCLGRNLPIMDREALTEYQHRHPAKHPTRVSELIPGLSYHACRDPRVKPPSWPVELYLTSFSTAAKFDTPKPLPTSAYYQPQVPRLRTRLHKDFFSDALLVGPASYGVDTDKDTLEQDVCVQGPHTSLPGAPYPYWGNQGACQCFGVIKDNRVLSRNLTTQLIGCPLPLTSKNPDVEQVGNTLFWMWYTVEDPPRPIVFTQTFADITVGTGLVLADYVTWQPQPVPDEIFTLPESCIILPSSLPTAPPACFKCHLPSTNDE